MAEVFVNLVTGASLPDAGSVRVFGQSDVGDRGQHRVVGGRRPIRHRERSRRHARRADACCRISRCRSRSTSSRRRTSRARAPPRWRAKSGLAEAEWDTPVGTLDGAARACVRLARALALDPAVLLLEHPTATVDRQDVPALGRRVRSVADRRGAAVVVLTADQAFAESLGGRLVTLDARHRPADSRAEGGPMVRAGLVLIRELSDGSARMNRRENRLCMSEHMSRCSLP